MKSGEEYIDPKVLTIDHHFGQYERFGIIASYHKHVLKKCVRLAGIQSGMNVLDFGCGRQMLRQVLPADVHYVGYDIVSEFSDIDDFRKQRYDIIFAIQVMHYPDKFGIEELAKEFARLAPILIVMVPSTGKFKKNILDRLFGLKHDADSTFRSEPRDIYSVLEKHYARRNFKRVFGIGEITRWETIVQNKSDGRKN